LSVFTHHPSNHPFTCPIVRNLFRYFLRPDVDNALHIIRTQPLFDFRCNLSPGAHEVLVMEEAGLCRYLLKVSGLHCFPVIRFCTTSRILKNLLHFTIECLEKVTGNLPVTKLFTDSRLDDCIGHGPTSRCFGCLLSFWRFRNLPLLSLAQFNHPCHRYSWNVTSRLLNED
jgi:hypothetical protein